MPFLDGLDFVRQSGAFEVSYRASSEAQEIDIEVETAGRASRRSGPVCLRKVIDMVNFGAAGGVHFAPALGFAERLRGPWDGADAFGATYQWSLRVKAMAPEFLRIAVEHLRRCGWDQPVRAMRIRGELAPDRTEHSVTTERARGWLDDGTTYPSLWQHNDFSVRGENGPGAAMRVVLAAPPSPEHIEALQIICARWLQLTATIVGQDGSIVVRTTEHLERMLPRFSFAANVFIAEMSAFGHAAEPSAALLANMLARFHTQQAALLEVTLALEGLVGWPRAMPLPPLLAPPPKPKPVKKHASKASPKKKKTPKSKSAPKRRTR